jgi:hypothetical protein
MAAELLGGLIYDLSGEGDRRTASARSPFARDRTETALEDVLEIVTGRKLLLSFNVMAPKSSAAPSTCAASSRHLADRHQTDVLTTCARDYTVGQRLS